MSVRMSNGVNRITILKKTEDGRNAQKIYDADDLDTDDDEIKFVARDRAGRTRRGFVVEELGTPKKQSKKLRPLDKKIRKSVRGQIRMLNRYIALHDRSSRKRRNGWARDFTKNIVKVLRKKS